MVQDILGSDVNLVDIQKKFIVNYEDDDLDIEIDEGKMLHMSVDMLNRSKSIKQDDKFFEQMLESAMSDPNNHYIDPIMYNVMVDPVVLSSGQVYDRATVLDERGKLIYN